MTLPSAIDPKTDEVARTALAEVQYLCEQRHANVRSPDFREDVLQLYDQRLAASLDALLVRGPHIVPWLLETLATAESPGDVCGIAVALLESRDPQAADRLLAALEASQEGPKQRGLLAALRRGPIDLLAGPLQKWFASRTSAQAAAAGEILAFHGRLEQHPARLTALCSDADPQVRRGAWRAAALAPIKAAEGH